MKMYRYEDNSHITLGTVLYPTVDLITFYIVKHTAKGKWITNEHQSIIKRFVLNNAKKRYAHETKLDAINAFLLRKQSQHRIITARMQQVNSAIIIGQQLKAGLT